MTCVSFVKSTGRISTIGLSWTKSYRRFVPIRNAVTILPAVALLARAGDDAGLDEIDDRVGEHLGVDAEVALVAERERGGGRDAADAQLERGAVGDELGDVLADPPLDVAELADRVLVGRHVDLDGEVDLAHVDEAVAERARHRAVELRDDGLRGPDRGVHASTRRAERAEAVGVGRGHVDEDRVERQHAALEQRAVGQEDRDVVGTALVDGRRALGPMNRARWRKCGGHLGRQVRAGPSRVEVDHARRRAAPAPARRGHRAGPTASPPRMEVDLVAGPDAGDGLVALRRSAGSCYPFTSGLKSRSKDQLLVPNGYFRGHKPPGAPTSFETSRSVNA